MFLRRVLLLPFTGIYIIVTVIRNFFYDRGIFSSCSFQKPVINIGNLKAGGTGKTPHVEFLLSEFSSEYGLAVVSRGYKRKTKGFVLAENGITAAELGDEPYQYFHKFRNIKVVVDEDRCEGVSKLCLKFSDIDAFILDDAFQHRKIKAGLNILLTEYQDPFYKDWPLPSGMLRESRHGAGRAEIIIVTKCPSDLSEAEQEKVKENIYRYAGIKPVFFTTYDYMPLTPLNNIDITLSRHYTALAFAGIANPTPFFDKLKSQFFKVIPVIFPDHHALSDTEKNKLVKKFHVVKEETKIIVTTEKDAVKIAHDNIFKNLPVFYYPIKVKFLNREAEFKKMIYDFLKKYNSL